MRAHLIIFTLKLFMILRNILNYFYQKIIKIRQVFKLKKKLILNKKLFRKRSSYLYFSIEFIYLSKSFIKLIFKYLSFFKNFFKKINILFYYSNELLSFKDLFTHKFIKSKIKLKVLFLTSLTGEYDELIDPKFIYEDADYFCFTDQNKINSGVWKPFWIPFIDKNLILSARFVKWRMLEFFTNYDVIVWQDANIIQTKDISLLILSFFNKNIDLMLFKHPFRNNVAQELYACASQKKINANQLKKFTTEYLNEFESNEMVETGLMLINPKCAKLKKIMTQTFYNMADSRIYRDQLFFPSLLIHSKINLQYINANDHLKSVRDIGYWELIPHNLNSIGIFAKSKSKIDTNNFPIKQKDNLKKVDIILPVYNAEKFTMRCIKSILPQLNKDIKLYVIDDFSEINFSNRLKQFLANKKYVQFSRNKNNLGYTKTVNYGVESFAKNDCFFVLNSDTIYPKFFFKKLTSLLFSSDSFSVVCSLGRNAGIFSTTKPIYNRFRKLNNFNDNNHYFHLPNDIHGACYGVKTDVFRKIGFLDEKAFPMGYGEENDYFLRLKEIRKSVVLSLSTYFIHYGNQSFGNEKRNINKILGKKSLEGKHVSVIEDFYKNVAKSNYYIDKIITNKIL